MLGTYNIDIYYEDVDSEDKDTLAKTISSFKYLNATLTFFLDVMMRPDVDIEQVVIHEMLHVSLTGTQKDSKGQYKRDIMERENQLLSYALKEALGDK